MDEQFEKDEQKQRDVSGQNPAEGEGYVFDFGGRQPGEGGGFSGGNLGGNPLPAQADRPKRKKKDPARIIGVIAGGVFVLAGGFFAGYFTCSSSLDDEVKSLIWAKDQIQSNYYEEISDDEFYGAVFDGVNGLLDPYSGYLSAEQYADRLESSTGLLSGMGITFFVPVIDGEEKLLILSVSGNSPAERAGVREGMFIEGFGLTEETVEENSSYDDFVQFFSERPLGESFALLLEDGTDGERSTVTLSREVFTENYVFYRSKDRAYNFTGEEALTLTESDNVLSGLDEDTAYIRLTQFNGGAAKQFAQAMNRFREEGRKNLILDLRNNGGGYLDIMCEISSYFCKNAEGDNPPVIRAEYRSGKEEIYYATANLWDSYFSEDSRIVVMADSGTASASECLLGAMIDYGAIGYDDIWLSERDGEARTYGKGIMQMLFPHVFEEDAIALTVARIVWPVSGNCIHGRGILPEDGTHTVSESYVRDRELNEVLAAAGFADGN